MFNRNAVTINKSYDEEEDCRVRQTQWHSRFKAWLITRRFYYLVVERLTKISVLGTWMKKISWYSKYSLLSTHLFDIPKNWIHEPVALFYICLLCMLLGVKVWINITFEHWSLRVMHFLGWHTGLGLERTRFEARSGWGGSSLILECERKIFEWLGFSFGSPSFFIKCSKSLVTFEVQNFIGRIFIRFFPSLKYTLRANHV